MPAHRSDLICEVSQLSYDFEKGLGHLVMGAGQSCDMRGCIALFEAIDKNVSEIHTFAGEMADTVYLRRSGKWVADQAP